MYLYVLLVCVSGPGLSVCNFINLTVIIPRRMLQQCLKTDNENYIFNNIASLWSHISLLST